MRPDSSAASASTAASTPPPPRSAATGSDRSDLGTEKWIGKSVRRTEDPPLLRGRGRYVDDLHRPGLLHLVVLRSPHAAATIRALDVTAARGAPGVVAVLTGADTAHVRPAPVSKLAPDQLASPYYVLAHDRVTYVGMPVAAVIATDPALGRDALDLVAVDYEPTPAVVDVESAAHGAPYVHPELGTNRCFTLRPGQDDVAAAFAAAAHVVEVRSVAPRIASAPLECRGAIAEYDADLQELTLWTSTQSPWQVRTGLVGALGLDENRIRVIAPDVGGGFGPKEALYQDEVLVALAAMRTGRPVKWIASRSDDLATTWQARGQIVTLQAAADADGQLLAIRARTLLDLGAEVSFNGARPAARTTQLSTGPYRVPQADVEGTGVFTNKAPTGPYRGAGRPEAALALEQAMDEIARRTGLDPAEVRRRNFVRPEDFPYQSRTGVRLDSGNYEKALDLCLQLLDYPTVRAEQARSTQHLTPNTQYLGIGLCAFVQPGSGGWESGVVRVEPTGKVTALTGSVPHGQGHRTVYAQILAERLGVAIADVVVRHGDSAMIPAGTGTFGSRSLSVGGNALALAADRVVAKARRLASHLLEVSPDDVTQVPGGFGVAGVPEKTVTWAGVAAVAYQRGGRPGGEEVGLESTTYFEGAFETFGSGVYGAVVRIDLDTGALHLDKLVAVDDCGVIVNPLLLEGQVIGGAVQGLGQALGEVVVYDENGQLLTGTFMDYAFPKCDDVPPIVLGHVETPTPINPLGTKGIGEAPTTGVPAAVKNAVLDALAPLGITQLELPLTPERLWRAINMNQ